MTTENKDFKVKNGLQVAGSGSFGGTLTVATPTEATHVATKGYVDALSGSMMVGNTAPASPTNGDQWFDTLTERVNVYYEGTWHTMASIDDTLNLAQHIHDTAIDGTGFIVTTKSQTERTLKSNKKWKYKKVKKDNLGGLHERKKRSRKKEN